MSQQTEADSVREDQTDSSSVSSNMYEKITANYNFLKKNDIGHRKGKEVLEN